MKKKPKDILKFIATLLLMSILGFNLVIPVFTRQEPLIAPSGGNNGSEITAGADDLSDAPWIIDGNTVYVDDNLVYASATPHTLQSSGDVVFEFESKAYTGDVDFAWGFNGSFMKPDAIWLWQNISHENYYYEEQEDWGCVDFYNVSNYMSLGIENYDNYSVTLGNKNNLYLFNVSYNYNASNASFDTGIYAFTEPTIIGDDGYCLCGNYNRSVKVWDNQSYYDWNPWLVDYTHVSWNHENMTDWYIIPNLPITKDTRYRCKIHLQQQHWDLQEHSGKYWFAFKPSSETIQQAISNNHFYCLDPWWSSSWDYYKTASISNKVDDYQMKLVVGNSTGGDVTCDGHAKSDFGDIRFVNLANDTEYPYWMENHTANTQATFWIKNSDNASTILMYYGNSGVSTTSNGTDTFIAWDDFDDGYSETDSLKAARGWTTLGATTSIQADPDDANNLVMRLKDDGVNPNAISTLDANYEAISIHYRTYTTSSVKRYSPYATDSEDDYAMTCRWESGEIKYYDGSSWQSFSPSISYSIDT